ncbi:MAG: helix-turn-helix domain-containing protein [Candidatus Gastranaerophilaceae bacterium]
MYQIKKLLGSKIKSIRNQQGITQEYFAEKIGISPRSVSFIENGKNYPAPETLAVICDVLNIEPYKLFLFPPEKNIMEIKRLLINKINEDDDFALYLYNTSKQQLS